MGCGIRSEIGEGQFILVKDNREILALTTGQFLATGSMCEVRCNCSGRETIITGIVVSQSTPTENDPYKSCSQIPNAALVKFVTSNSAEIPLKHGFVHEAKPVKLVTPKGRISPRQYSRHNLLVFYDGLTEPAIAKYHGFTAMRQQQQGDWIQRKVQIRTDHSLGPLPLGSVVTPGVRSGRRTPLWGLVESWERQEAHISYTVCDLGYALNHLRQLRVE